MRIVVAVSLALLGCGPGNTFHGDESFTIEERSAIEGAAMRMAARTGGEPIAIVWDGEIGDDEQRIVREAPPGADATVGGRYSVSTRTPRVIYLRPGLSVRDLHIITAHEIGHYYGLDHHAERGVMNAGNSVDDWTAADVDVCRRAGRC